MKLAMAGKSYMERARVDQTYQLWQSTVDDFHGAAWSEPSSFYRLGLLASFIDQCSSICSLLSRIHHEAYYHLTATQRCLHM